MSIKKLFGASDKKRNYLSDTTQKDAFVDAESGRNVRAIAGQQEAFVPQINWADPANFAKYGSAYLYYKGAIERIQGYYPYDGSDAEINEFYNNLLDIEKYIFNDLYPRTNGYVLLSADGWGSRVGSLADGYGLSDTLEYITFYGGPHSSSYGVLADAFNNPHNDKYQSANLYQTNVYQPEGLPTDYGVGTRESNLKSDFDAGVTVEFWLKKSAFTNAKTSKEVILDVWNNELSSAADYGRITIELTGAATGSPFRITAQSGTSGIFQQSIGTGLTTGTLNTFQHYAIKLENSGTNTFRTKLYVNGYLNDTNLRAGSLNELKSTNMVGRIGALLTPPSGTSTVATAGKLSASIDEFRFWKVGRSSKEIGRNWFTNVWGGANTDISNTTLGVYYKFNEGITLSASIDSSVLDYSGRISNGAWTGYGSNSRNTESAIVLAGAATKEYKDPIIYSVNPDVALLKTNLLNSGTYHDASNNNSFVSLIPTWIREDDEGDLSELNKITHIAGAYFDKLWLQIEALPKFKSPAYTSSSYKPLPFSQHLPQSLGLYMPELFVDADVSEKFLNRDSTSLFEGDLNDTKNQIYLNIYNNLANIYKNKGTERSIRNILRCFNLDDRLIKLSVYSNNNTYPLQNNLQQTLVSKNSLNFNNVDNTTAVVFQYPDASNPQSSGYISGSSGASVTAVEDPYGMTTEADVTFPSYNEADDPVNRDFLTTSLFGMHQANTTDPTNTTYAPSDSANFQVFAVKPEVNSKNVYFKLTSSVTPFPIPTLTSSLFFDVYDNDRWNLSVRIKPSNYPVARTVTGSNVYNYDVIFRGINTLLGSVQDSFVVSGTMTQAVGSNFLRAPKRVYAGAQRTNITGAILQKSDAWFSGVRYWTKYLKDAALDQHMADINNAGISGSYQSISPLESGSAGEELSNWNTLALNWNFDNVTGSDATGNFYVTDISSGSSTLRDNYGWLGKISGYQHTGYGYGFATSSTSVIDNRLVNSFKFVDPEMPTSTEMIRILSEDEKVFGLPVSQTVPDFFYVLEKSLYGAISEEMLTFFAGVIDFNNLIGEPVNRYRERYKMLEHLREIFFRRVTTVTDVEKYITYYKWFDDALTEIISQLIPVSSGFVPDVLNTIESHVLERNKYRSIFPTLGTLSPFEVAATPILGINELTYNWRLNHHPVSNLEKENSQWWLERPLRQTPAISSGDGDIDCNRNNIKFTKGSVNEQSAAILTSYVGGVRTTYNESTFVLNKLAAPYKLQVLRRQEYGGGVNFTDTKNIHFTYNALYPAGPIFITGSETIPENVLVFFAKDIEPLPDTTDVTSPPELKKTNRVFKVNHGRDWQDGLGYSNTDSTYALPFNILSSSVVSGYNKEVVDNITDSIEITNLHNDVYGPEMEVPMQGAFTNFAVGGHQSRHIPLNTGTDNYTNRPEAWKLLLGTITGSTPDVTGALGMVGADYPFPNTASYPSTVNQKAVYYRGFVAKRPVNIRNIKSTTGSVLGNYTNNWQVVSTVGAYSNPRHFVDNQPSLPAQITETPSASQARSILDVHRTDQGHFQFIPDYSVAYLTGTTNKSVIIGRFAAPGGIDTMGIGYSDIRAAELSVYNTLSYRNWAVLRPLQAPSGSTSEAVGEGTTGIRVSDIHGQDFGLNAHCARHAARFGRDSLSVTNPGASYDQLPAMFKVNRNRRPYMVDGGLGTFATSSKYDNFYVQHQIPRNDRQYSWVTNSLAPDSNSITYYGMAPVYGPLRGLRSSSTDGYVAYFNYVTESQVTIYKAVTLAALGPKQPTFPLNILIHDPVDDVVGSPNTLGYSLSTKTDPSTSENIYLNRTFLNKYLVNRDYSELETNYFNLLMTQRGNTYGWNWKSARNADHPVLLKHKKENILTVANRSTHPTTINSYRLPPVSTRGRTVAMNLNVAGENVSLQTTYNNDRIHFNEAALNNLQYPTTKINRTPFNQIVRLVNNNGFYAFNWIHYTENLFPSERNAYLSRSLERTGFDNKFWRNTNTDRVDLGANTANSFNISVSQSCWPLDAQEDFLTRTGPVLLDTGSPFIDLISGGKAGELQNNYVLIHTGAAGGAANSRQSLRPGALYARKQLLQSPLSVVSPSGIPIPETASLSNPFSDPIQIYAGEALWEAGTQAGIVTVDTDTLDAFGNPAATFEASASAPWFNSYADFKADLKLMAKDYSIIPEFRISEHVGQYINYGLLNRGKSNTFEIPGTNINSTTASFYKDYSNSEFMNRFSNIADATDLDPQEIRLVCKAAIRFNPYKGFYPAQRTLDLITQFSKSYGKGFVSDYTGGPSRRNNAGLRPLMQPLFAPGVLYNSIKSGIAVDYPVLTSPEKLGKNYFGAYGTNNWMISAANTASIFAGTVGYTGGKYWDYRVPFEAIIKPQKYLPNIEFIDMEPHPSASLNVTASWNGAVGDRLYPLMAENFFGQVGSFFLKQGNFSRLESNMIATQHQSPVFEANSVYGARLKIYRSTRGMRTYENEYGGDGTNAAFGMFGAKVLLTQSGEPTQNAFGEGVFPLPQDPQHNPNFQESFTMYSRTTAFGPPVTGRRIGPAAANLETTTGSADSLNGFNWSFTPPYYNGEAWLDLIFRPSKGTTYDTVESILSEIKTVYWRCDPGMSASTPGAARPINLGYTGSQLIYSYPTNSAGTLPQIPYDGNNVNKNAMQINSSINCFGVENVYKRESQSGRPPILTNEIIGKKWVIQPKWETPMLNFNNRGVHPISASEGTLTLPESFGTESVPRGMWHQFGVIPETADKGIFLEIGDIPINWLKNHYKVINRASRYNNFAPLAPASASHLYQNMKSLIGPTEESIFNFEQDTKRLGELAEKRVIREAVVAVPYILESVESPATAPTSVRTQRKRFITIPRERIKSATTVGSRDGDSLKAAGQSIRDLIQKMDRYVLPPQFDFLNNKDINPMAMYIFEFKYTLDRDDLSYIWQNLAPREYQKIRLKSSQIAHKLGDSEILAAKNLMDNDNLRWMVFKVKQRATTQYSDLVVSSGRREPGPHAGATQETLLGDTQYKLGFNWPYDYLSVIELIKMDAEVLYKPARRLDIADEFQEPTDTSAGGDVTVKSDEL
jgi:hypothetical protein